MKAAGDALEQHEAAAARCRSPDVLRGLIASSRRILQAHSGSSSASRGKMRRSPSPRLPRRGCGGFSSAARCLCRGAPPRECLHRNWCHARSRLTMRNSVRMASLKSRPGPRFICSNRELEAEWAIWSGLRPPDRGRRRRPRLIPAPSLSSTARMASTGGAGERRRSMSARRSASGTGSGSRPRRHRALFRCRRFGTAPPEVQENRADATRWVATPSATASAAPMRFPVSARYVPVFPGSRGNR